MINTFLTRIGSIFDSRFWVAFWAPAFAAVVLGGVVWAMQSGFSVVAQQWDAMTATQQVMAGLASLLLITVVAYILQAMDIWIVRQYEGYWPWWLGWFQRKAEDAERAAKARYVARNDGEAWPAFPKADDQVRATGFGNCIRAAEEYPGVIYRLDAIVWWPRLVAVMPPEMRTRVDAAFTPVVALLNLCTILWLWALIGGAWTLFNDARAWVFGVVFFGGLLAAWIAYRAAVAAAANYAGAIRVAFDCYRRELLKQLSMPLPDTLQAEGELWHTLTQLHAFANWPWEAEGDRAGKPFPFDNFKEAAAPAPPPVHTVRIVPSIHNMRRSRRPYNG